MIGAVLGLGLIWAVIEILVWIGIAQFISGWWVFLWFIAAFVIGSGLMRTGMKNIGPMAQQMQQGGMMNPGIRPPQSVMIKSLALVAAGILLMIPGVLSDIAALFLMLPPVQNKLHDYANRYMMKNQQKMMDMMAQRMQDMGMDPSQFQQGGGSFGAGGAFGGGSFGGFSSTGSGKFGGGFSSSGRGTTVDSEATVVNPKNVKKLESANDD